MCDLPQLYWPKLEKIVISKDGNRSGLMRVLEMADTVQSDLYFPGSFPFSKTDLIASYTRTEREPDTSRMDFFERCVEALVQSYDGEVAPTRFIARDGAKWKMDRACAPWLVNSGRWQFVRHANQPQFALRRIGR